jgi:hypothetical protein
MRDLRGRPGAKAVRLQPLLQFPRHLRTALTNLLRFAEVGVARRLREVLDRLMTKARPKAKKVSCESCYFKCNLLCALSVDEPCVTYRPDSPEGLRPPRQMRFAFRDESIRRTSFAFPSAQEQAALHA